MTRRLHIINLIGVIALALLCVFQWRHDRQLNLEINRLERIRLDQEKRIAEQERQVFGLTDDLARFKDRFSAAQAELAEASRNLILAERNVAQLTAERDQLKSALADWAEAVKERDTRLTEANERIRDLADRLNASVEKFNELATNYNALVKQLDDLRAQAAPGQ